MCIVFQDSVRGSLARSLLFLETYVTSLKLVLRADTTKANDKIQGLLFSRMLVFSNK